MDKSHIILLTYPKAATLDEIFRAHEQAKRVEDRTGATVFILPERWRLSADQAVHARLRALEPCTKSTDYPGDPRHVIRDDAGFVCRDCGARIWSVPAVTEILANVQEAL